MNGITKETFKEADTDTKLDILFDYRHEDHNNIKEILKLLGQHPKDCQSRFDKIENKSFWQVGISGLTGLVGGAAAVFAKMKIWG